MSSSFSRPGLSGEWTFDGMSGGQDALARSGFFAEGARDKWIGDVGGHRGVSFRLEQGGGSVRNELVPVELGDGFDRGTHAQIGKTAWYGMSTYMPQDWAGSDDSMDILMQWVAQPDFSRGESWRHPVVALGTSPEKDGTHFFLAIRADSGDVTRKGDYDQDRRIDLGRIDDSLGAWTDWVWRIDWNSGSDGALQLWRNGEMLVDLSGIGTAYNDDLGPYFKFGVYKWPWGGGAETGADSRGITFDDLRIAAGGGAGYGSVSPDGEDFGVQAATFGPRDVWGDAGGEALWGGATDDTLHGGDGDDTARGEGGDDRVLGGTGADELWGGPGGDTFAVEGAWESNRGAEDRIRDFDAGEGDRIDLSAVDADAGRSGDQDFDFIGRGGFSGAAGELRAVKTGEGRRLEGDVDGDGGADLQVALPEAWWLGAGDLVL